MRTRLVKPGFFTNEFLAECDPMARLLFIGLWCAADREGRLEYRPKRIRTDIFPHDIKTEIEPLLAQLTQKGFLQIYDVAGSQYIQIDKFCAHQHPHPREAKSIIPPPTDGNVIDQSTQRPEQPRKKSRKDNGKHPIGDWEPNDQDYQWARRNAFDDNQVRTAFNQMKDWAVANGKVKNDWSAAWRNWLRKMRQDGIAPAQVSH